MIFASSLVARLSVSYVVFRWWMLSQVRSGEDCCVVRNGVVFRMVFAWTTAGAYLICRVQLYLDLYLLCSLRVSLARDESRD